MATEKDEEQGERGFVVIDKRGRDESEPSADEPQEAQAEAPPHGLPKVDFSAFIMSLGTSGLYHLGLIADPETGEPGKPMLELARQTIETLEVIQEKTQGNLDEDEGRLLRSLLTELRMRYVEISKA